MLISLAWFMAVVITFPMYLNIDKFSRWLREVDIHEDICMTPTRPSSLGYVLYAGIVIIMNYDYNTMCISIH